MYKNLKRIKLKTQFSIKILVAIGVAKQFYIAVVVQVVAKFLVVVEVIQHKR